MYRNNTRGFMLPNDAPAPPATDGPEAGGGAAPTTPTGNDRGFPDATPVAQMTDAERANYYKFHNRQAENKLSQFSGVTPEQVSQMQAELQALRDERLTADEKALKTAAEQAAAEARAAAEAELRPKLDQASIRSVAAEFLSGDQLSAFVDSLNPAKFYDDAGDIDSEKVIGHLTALFGPCEPERQRPEPYTWGQYSGIGGVPVTPGSAGLAEAKKRFG